jgi:nucleoside-triphosphatase THEP1
MNVLLTGERQVGKTTVCRRVVELVCELGYSPAGVLSPALIGRDGFPVAYCALMVADGEQRLLAQANGDLGKRNPKPETRTPKLSEGGPRTGCYSFDADVLSWVIERLRAAIRQGCDLLIVDEIGPLELEQGKGLAPILSDLSAVGLPPLLLVVRPGLTAQLHERLPAISFLTFTITQENRQILPEAIVKELLFDKLRMPVVI